jgi:chromosome segregation ATPase
VEIQTPDVRQRAVSLIQEAGSLLGMIPELLDLTAELQTRADSLSKDAEGMRKEVAALRSEVQQLKTDREDTADGLTVTMNEILRLVTEAVGKLRSGDRRSPFWREGPVSASDGAASRPAATPGTPWNRDA